jgi:hypothetical protein
LRFLDSWSRLAHVQARRGGRVVDQDVQPLPGQARLQPGEQRVHVAVRAKFGPYRERSAAVGLDHRHGLGGRGLAVGEVACSLVVPLVAWDRLAGW